MIDKYLLVTKKYDRIIKKYNPLLVILCQRYRVPGYQLVDLLQEARIKMFSSLPKANPELPLGPYITRVINNRLRDLYRSSKGRSHSILNEAISLSWDI